ncbi:MAG: DMT family transporter [Rhodospirillaceae bacterium]|nr:DMT family transporter [Rhodospirillaceae bacterium]
MAGTPSSDESGNLTGILLISAGVAILTAMDVVAKWLVVADYSVMQIMAIRGWIITALLLLWMTRNGGINVVKTKRPGAHALRVVIGFAAPYLFFQSLATMPLADVTVIFFGATTFLVTALSAVLLGEKVGIHRWGAVAIGFAGVMVAMRPGSEIFNVQALYALGSGVSYALLMIATRWLGPGEGILRLVFYYNFGMAIFASLFLPAVFKPMPVDHMAMIGLMAALAVSGHLCMTRALTVASIGVLAPFEYSALVWAALLGFLFFGHMPDANVFIGAGIIVACGLYMVHRERLAARRRRLEQPAGDHALLLADPMPVVVSVEIETDDEKI